MDVRNNNFEEFITVEILDTEYEARITGFYALLKNEIEFRDLRLELGSGRDITTGRIIYHLVSFDELIPDIRSAHKKNNIFP